VPSLPCPLPPVPLMPFMSCPRGWTGCLAAGPLPGLAQFLAAVPDHRRAQGRHSLVSVLLVACVAVAAGAKSLVAIAEWAADAPGHVLDALAVRRDPCGGALVPPSETTIRRTLADTDPGELDAQLRAWTAAGSAAGHPADGVPDAGQEPPVAQVMADGKSLRGAVQADGRAVHLLAAMTGPGAVVAQREVGHKTNEITQVKPLLDPLDLRGAVITLDALHCQRETARYIVADKKADYIFTAVKDNQPSLFDALDALAWQDAPVQHVMRGRGRGRGHGRAETRTIQVLPAPDGIFPHASQAFLIERHVTDLKGNPVSDIAALGITSMNEHRGTPAVLATAVRGHWGIENKLHYATSPTAKTPPASAPGTHPRTWPPCATPPSAPSAQPAGPTSPQDSAGQAETTRTRCHSSGSQRENADPRAFPCAYASFPGMYYM